MDFAHSLNVMEYEVNPDDYQSVFKNLVEKKICHDDGRHHVYLYIKNEQDPRNYEIFNSPEYKEFYRSCSLPPNIQTGLQKTFYATPDSYKKVIKQLVDLGPRYCHTPRSPVSIKPVNLKDPRNYEIYSSPEYMEYFRSCSLPKDQSGPNQASPRGSSSGGGRTRNDLLRFSIHRRLKFRRQ